MKKTKFSTPGALWIIAGALLINGTLFAQTPDWSNLSSDQKDQLLRAMQNAGIGATPGTGSQPTTAQPQLPQAAGSSTSTIPQGTHVQSTPVPQPPSSIEAVFSTRLPPNSQPLLQFGYDFFQRQPGSQFPAVSDTYVVGPGDVLVLYLWGDAVDIAGLLSQYQLQVDRNGQCFFAPVGSFSASGLDLQSIRNYLRSALSKKFKKFDLNLTLSQMRTFPIYVSGFVNSPGPVMATAVDSIFYVIAGAGGVAKTGSLRNIVLKRKGEVRDTPVDLYDVLVFAKSTDIQVHEGDSIWIPQIGPVAAIAGAVKRPAIYELKQEKAVSDLVALAGGFLPSADATAASVVRFEGDQRRFIDSNGVVKDLKTLELKDGDLVGFDSVRDYVFNKIQVEGEIRYPGSYSIEKAGTLRALLDVAQVLPDTDMTYARVHRIDDGGFSRNSTFQPKEVLSGRFDMPLKGRDRVVFFTFGQNLQDVDFNAFPDTVTLEGDVRYPGMYAWRDGLSLKDIISRDNFMVDTNVNYGGIVRQQIGSIAPSIVTFSPLDVVEGRSNITLAPMDRVRFYSKTLDEPIEISGLVQEAKILVYYNGMDLVDVLRVVTPAGDPDRMKVYVYRSDSGPSQAGQTTGETAATQESGAATATQASEDATAGGYTGAGQPMAGPGVAPPVGAISPSITTPTPPVGTNPALNAYPGGTGEAGVATQGQNIPSASSAMGGASQILQSQASAAGDGRTAASKQSNVSTTPAPQQKRFVIYLRDILKTQTGNQVPLQPGDRVVFALTEENEKNPQIIVRGQLRNPGAISFTEGMRLSDALRLAGGYLSGAYPQGLIILRQSVAALQRQQLDRAAKTLQMVLQQNIEQSVSSLSNLSSANANSAIALQIQAQQAELSALRSQISDILGRISISMPATLEELKGSPADILLDDGDSIFVPRTPTSVQIFGEVYNPTTVAYRQGLKVSDYISSAGGTTDNADMNASYVIHADGTTASQKQRPWSLFTSFIDDPASAGDTIIVAKKPVVVDMTLPVVQSVAEIVASLASTAFSIWAIVKPTQ